MNIKLSITSKHKMSSLGRLMIMMALPAGLWAQVPSADSTVMANDTAYRSTATAPALSDTATTVWNLQQCLDYAKKNNITIQSMRLNAASDEQSLIQAKAAKYPELSGNVSQNLSHYKSGFGANSSYGLSANVPIYQGGYIQNDIKSKQLSMQAANLDVSAAENDITLDITQAYLNILLAKENIVYYQDLILSTAALVKQGQQLFDVGQIAKKDLLELQATLASDQYQLVLAQNTNRQNILALKQLLQLPTTASFDVTGNKDLQTSPSLLPLGEAEDLALKNRPEVQSSQLNVEVQQAELEKVRAGLKPTLSLGGAIASNYAGNSTGQYFPQINDNFYQQLGLTLSIPILDRKVTKTNTAKAKIAIDQAQLNLLNTQTTLSQNIERSYLSVNNALQQYEAAEEQLTYAKEAYRIASEQLRIGTYVTVDYLQQKNIYIQAEQAFIQAKYSAALYARIYNFYAGTPVTQ